jgi:phosphoglucomutase
MGEEKMKSVMSTFRNGIQSVGGLRVLSYTDYKKGVNGLPKSDVLKFSLEGNCSFTIRPSGTEPKLKIYLSISKESKELSEKAEQNIKLSLEQMIF